MTQDEIVAMAEQAGWDKHEATYDTRIYAFAKLVAEKERNRAWTQEHWTAYEMDIVAREREACADICDSEATCEGIAQKCDNAIRAREKECSKREEYNKEAIDRALAKFANSDCEHTMRMANRYTKGE